MQRNPAGIHGTSQNVDSSGQQYFDTTGGGGGGGGGGLANQQYSLADSGQSQQPPMHMSQMHVAQGGTAGSYMPNNSTSIGIMSSLQGGAPSLTFTPSGSSGSSAPSFRNVKRMIKSLTDNYETTIAASFSADAAFVHNYITGEREQRSADSSSGSAERDEKPIPEPEVKLDAELYALVQLKTALDAFRQTANQALWTSRSLPHTAGSHFDAEFELPQNLDNPTLNEVQLTATDQIRLMTRMRKALADCNGFMFKMVDKPTAEEIAEFLKIAHHHHYP
ncbi:hypothetical protein BV898_14932 [Hypsibius exemplaris]|uniref:Uncharacterized protein n=1 Tax=Hypsibius exemplaris TaxID=2072580 RepID=A0A9X6N9I7_HYPEX|nr:hypothetical protein BV898_14932 [Hypsibius exemplaris]